MNKFLFSLLFLAGSICWLNAQIPENQLVRIAKFKDNKSAAISYTFDDGMKEHYTRVAPELEITMPEVTQSAPDFRVSIPV